ncbi:MAG: ParA family protein [Anaerolineae bacterium]|nr:ParA family protein [Anaerolineae bacterium]
MTQCYTFANQKGGVGKTTTVVNVAGSLADMGYHVLVVDIDPQCNGTTCLGYNARDLSTSIYDVLSGNHVAEDAILDTRWEGLSILPSVPALAGIVVELNALPPFDRAIRLKERLTGLSTYDYILIDSPPSLGVLTVNGLTAADGVIVPVQCEYLALEGLAQLIRTIKLVQRGLNPRLLLKGVVMTMYDVRTTLSKEVVQEVRAYFPDNVYETIIPRNVRVSEAPSYGEPVVFYAPTSSGARAYRKVTEELLRSDGHPV